MKIYRNIYTTFEEGSLPAFEGEVTIHYNGNVFYGSVRNEETGFPDGYDPQQDIFYGCSCEFKELKEFKKVYRNIYMTMTEETVQPDGDEEILYTGDLFYQMQEDQIEQQLTEYDRVIRCCCEFHHIKEFKKVEE